jgi:hypothetical protein
MSNEPNSHRIITFDVLRGMFIVLMAINHIPSPIHTYTSQPLGYVSAAEGFIFISALLLGVILRKRAASGREDTINPYIRGRIRKIYCCHISAVLFAFLFAGNILGHIQPYQNLVHTYCKAPAKASIAAVFLLYQPPLMDILPMYVIFLAITPLALAISRKWGWKTVCSLSIGLWLMGQLGFRDIAIKLLKGFVLIDMGMFDLFSWQLIWILALAIGHANTEAWFNTKAAKVFFLFSACFFLLMFCFRWPWIPISLDMSKYWWTVDKWKLGPLRVLNFFAIVYILASFDLKQVFRNILFRPFALIGKNALACFCAHLGFCIVFIGAIQYFSLDSWTINFIIASQLLLIFFVALIFNLSKTNQRQKLLTSKAVEYIG